MTSPAPLSYSHGTSPQPLLGETIGANLRRIAAAHGGREALVDVPVRTALDLRGVRRGHRHAGPGPDRGRDAGR